MFIMRNVYHTASNMSGNLSYGLINTAISCNTKTLGALIKSDAKAKL